MAPFQRRERKHKRLAKQKNHGDSSATEPIPDVIIPESQAEREARRSKLAAQIREQQPESKISSKKRKRLDKYIDTKLKKDENAELLRKLALQRIDTSLLQSSKKLGRVNETKKERLSRALQERAAGIDGEGHDEVLYEPRAEIEEDEQEDDSDDGYLEPEALAVKAPAALEPGESTKSFGSGLKRPLETDDAGRPVIKKRKRRKWKTEPVVMDNEASSDDESAQDMSDSEPSEDFDGSDDGDEWAGFDSDDAPDHMSIKSNPVDSGDSTEHSGSEDGTNDDDSDEDDDDVSESALSIGSGRGERVSAFKQWAESQRNVAADFTPSIAPTNDAAIRATFKPRQLSPDPAASALADSQSSGERTARPSAAITIPRSDEIQAARLELPVVQEEQRIMEAIHTNPIVIVCGATGSGKTTQVPQMMFESGYGSHVGDRSPRTQDAHSAAVDQQSRGMIGVTQPRRVAAVSVADRVASELGSTYKMRVAHQVRYDSNVSRDSAIKFMTDGILLREISQDFILSRYSAIVIDEAHERSVNTDILIGMLSRIVKLRAELAKENPDRHYPLKLVIMSATLRVSDFAENQRLFRTSVPPIVQAEGRQYPVTVHFSRRTQRDFVTETVNKVARGHRKLPPGGILVFLTSQNDIQTVAKRLRDKLGSSTAGLLTAANGTENDDLEDDSDDKRNNDYLEGEEDAESDDEPEITGLDPDAEDPEFNVPDDQPSFGVQQRGVLKPHILPLYAALPSAQQLKVFKSPPEGSRLIVLATNVAETSLTIPGVRYVFDCGRAKEKRYDSATGVQTFEVDWISKASASQRSGRAGRTGPGHCYRLYSSAVYEQYFAEHTIPEILRTPLESTVLQLKAMDIENVINFPFPTSPDAVQLQQAERLLTNLGAIDENSGKITETGREIMAYPVSPRFGKMLLLAKRNAVLSHTIAVVAALGVGDLFIPEMAGASSEDAEQDEGSDSDDDRRLKRQLESAAQTASQQRHQAYTRSQATLSRWDDHSDVVKLLTAVAAHAEASGKNKPMSAAVKFCEDFFLREKGMSEVQQLRHQLQNIVAARNASLGSAKLTFSDALSLPSEKERKMLNQIVAAGFIDQVAIRTDLLKDSEPIAFGRKPRRAIEVAYRTLVPSTTEPDRTLHPVDQELQRSVFIHPSSVLAHLAVKEMPQYIIYSHLSRAAPSTIAGNKVPRTRLHPLTVVGPKQLAALADGTPLLEIGKPIGKIEEVEGSLGKQRLCWVSVSIKAPGGGGASWPLTAWKVLQKRSGKGEWKVEKVLAR